MNLHNQKPKGAYKEESNEAREAASTARAVANQFYKIACACRMMAKDVSGRWWYRLLPRRVKLMVVNIVSMTGICNGKS